MKIIFTSMNNEDSETDVIKSHIKKILEERDFYWYSIDRRSTHRVEDSNYFNNMSKHFMTYGDNSSVCCDCLNAV